MTAVSPQLSTAILSAHGQDAETANEMIGLLNAVGTGPVTSFNTRTGAVVPASADYTSLQVTYDHTSSGLAATTAQAGIDELASTRAKVFTYTSSAGAGGSSTEAMTLTGLLATDTVLSVSQKTPGANHLPLIGYSTLANNSLTGIWSADPGAGTVIVVSVKR